MEYRSYNDRYEVRMNAADLENLTKPKKNVFRFTTNEKTFKRKEKVSIVTGLQIPRFLHSVIITNKRK